MSFEVNNIRIDTERLENLSVKDALMFQAQIVEIAARLKEYQYKYINVANVRVLPDPTSDMMVKVQALIQMHRYPSADRKETHLRSDAFILEIYRAKSWSCSNSGRKTMVAESDREATFKAFAEWTPESIDLTA